MRLLGFLPRLIRLLLAVLLSSGLVMPLVHEVSQALERLEHDETHHSTQDKHEPHAEKPCTSDIHHHDCALHHGFPIWNKVLIWEKRVTLPLQDRPFVDPASPTNIASLSTPPSRAPPFA